MFRLTYADEVSRTQIAAKTRAVMADAWFVSDIHIDSMQDPKARDFLAFLNTLTEDRPATHLFLVGDIFDLWVGPHQYFVDRFEPIVQRLRQLVNSGVEVHYFEGNHDLHLQNYWQNNLGVQVHSGPEYFEINAKVLRVEHGDQTDPDDKGYRFLRWFLRTPPLRLLAHNLPQKAVSWIGTKASHASRDYTSQVKTIDSKTAIQKLRTHADKAYAQNPFDLLVNGHVHIVDDYQAENFRAINLGTWLEKPRALHISVTTPQLVPLYF
jgi:UDP-2,3-diacylglucosamine hydrolase